jgi:hypothetical protein
MSTQQQTNASEADESLDHATYPAASQASLLSKLAAVVEEPE